jgi:hypothetical protein
MRFKVFNLLYKTKIVQVYCKYIKSKFLSKERITTLVPILKSFNIFINKCDVLFNALLNLITGNYQTPTF